MDVEARLSGLRPGYAPDILWLTDACVELNCYINLNRLCAVINLHVIIILFEPDIVKSIQYSQQEAK